jgi:hypothetical protein
MDADQLSRAMQQARYVELVLPLIATTPDLALRSVYMAHMFAQVMEEEEPMAENVDAREAITQRLQNGHTYLIKTYAQLLAMPDVGLGTPEEAKFIDALDLWIALESQHQALWPDSHCIMGRGMTCPDTSPACCRACLSAQQLTFAADDR